MNDKVRHAIIVRLTSIVTFAVSRLLSLILTLALLAGCAKGLYRYKISKPSLQEIRDSYIDQLSGEGVKIIHYGQTIRIILMTDFVFKPQSANLYPDYRFVLGHVARLMATYQKTYVKVVAFSDSKGDLTHKNVLTARQAQVVATTLWNGGNNTRLQYAVSSGYSQPVDWNDSARGRFMNRRIEISFRYYPETKPYS